MADSKDLDPRSTPTTASGVDQISSAPSVLVLRRPAKLVKASNGGAVHRKGGGFISAERTKKSACSACGGDAAAGPCSQCGNEGLPPVQTWDAHLARASALCVEIPTATDGLNASLRRAEQALTTLNLGVTAAVSLNPLEDARADWQQYLRFGKDSTGWRLLLESGPDSGDPEDWSESPLLNASKEVRLQAVARLPALLEKLVETAEEHLASLRQRAAEADVFASTVARRKG